MWQDPSEMRQEAFVNGEESFGTNSLAQTIEYALVEIAILVVQPRHDSICVEAFRWSASLLINDLRLNAVIPTWRVHETADDKAADGTTT